MVVKSSFTYARLNRAIASSMRAAARSRKGLARHMTALAPPIVLVVFVFPSMSCVAHWGCLRYSSVVKPMAAIGIHRPSRIPFAFTASCIGCSPPGKDVRLTPLSPYSCCQPSSIVNTSIPLARVMETVAVTISDQRNSGSLEFFARREPALERHEIGVIENTQADALRIRPAANLGAFHVAGNFGEDATPNP